MSPVDLINFANSLGINASYRNHSGESWIWLRAELHKPDQDKELIVYKKALNLRYLSGSWIATDGAYETLPLEEAPIRRFLLAWHQDEDLVDFGWRPIKTE
ncbi:MAG: hypothetical protein KDE59_32335 [Anaerolineales bacterium]|nr:hypothetical protein [Anaerolineales bacterium]MCB0014357.1 hypothetical protein [Anaerolineales bacterium]